MLRCAYHESKDPFKTSSKAFIIDANFFVPLVSKKLDFHRSIRFKTFIINPSVVRVIAPGRVTPARINRRTSNIH
jgi:hypothetical protein